ncbi:hypothetical protein GOBAR_DD30341 [Gossypium barbadense]|nr:hypothetical protein GOBAR_DD30341 [Gossypium barbadense]
MKLDTTGMESAAPVWGSHNELVDEFSAAPSFELPNTTDFDGFQKEAIQMVKPAKGTTTLAFIFKEGVMVAADSRASMGGYICMSKCHFKLVCKPVVFKSKIALPQSRILFCFFLVLCLAPCIHDHSFLFSGELCTSYRYDMSVEEAAELARRAIYHATFRDGASGGVASVYYVGPNGWKKLSGDDVGELHYRYYPVMPSTVEQEMVEVTGA